MAKTAAKNAGYVSSRERKEFKYNEDQTISVTQYIYDETSATFYNLNEDTQTIIKLDPNNQQSELTSTTKINDSENFTATIKFSYDKKNNPFRNVIGVNSLLGFEYGKNNITSIKINSNLSEIIGSLTEEEKNFVNFMSSLLGIEVEAVYNYNSNNFPENANLKVKMGSSLNTVTQKFEY